MMDNFTAELLLNMIDKKHSAQDVYEIYKNLGLGDYSGGATIEQVSWFNEHKGSVVKVKGTPYTGVIHKLNTSTCGFYEGSRYPIFVKIDNAEHCKSAKGLTFEYGIEQLELAPPAN